MISSRAFAVYSVAVAAYITSGLLAFGHCAAHAKTRHSYILGEVPLDAFERSSLGLFAAVANPLYWTWVYFETPEIVTPPTDKVRPSAAEKEAK